MGLKALKKKKATKACGEHPRIYIRRSLWTKGRGPLRQAQGPGFSFSTVSEFASGEPAEPVELPVKVRGREIFALRLHLP